MSSNQIQDEGLLALCDALASTPSTRLRLLDVAHNGILGSVGHKTGNLAASGVEVSVVLFCKSTE
jgi:hypothetical protein